MPQNGLKKGYFII